MIWMPMPSIPRASRSNGFAAARRQRLRDSIPPPLHRSTSLRFRFAAGRVANKFARMILTSLTKFRETGLLLLRIGLAATLLYNSRNMMFGGPAVWTKTGHAVAYVGIHFWPVFWGFMAAFSEFFGAILLAFGLFFRPTCILLAITMTVAAAMHLRSGDGFLKASWAIDMAVVFWTLILIGPGKYSVDKN
jgi:putative oxidoreductase